MWKMKMGKTAPKFCKIIMQGKILLYFKTDRNRCSNFNLMVYHHNLMTTHDAITWLIYKF
jgi:hypothetical protein